MAKTVYVVTSGCYSDYGIEAIFSDRKSAEKFIADAKAVNAKEDEDGLPIVAVYWANEASIEEWPLDAQRGARVYDKWQCGMMLDDGSLMEQVRHGQEFGQPEDTTHIAERVPAYGMRGIVRAISCKSAEHCVKLAAEARQAWLRERRNP